MATTVPDTNRKYLMLNYPYNQEEVLGAMLNHWGDANS